MKNKFKNKYVFILSTIVTFIILISPLIIIYRIFNSKEDKIRFMKNLVSHRLKEKKVK